jgi:hypothetical protein
MRPSRTEPGHNELQSATGKKRRLKMSTVIRRLRVRLDSGNKIEAVKQARKDAGYSLHEALRLVQHCEGYHGLTNEELAFLWCGSCRNSPSACQCAAPASRDSKPTLAQVEEHAVRQAQPPTEEQPFKCKCGDHQCENEWHRLAMWLMQDPVNNYRRLLAYMEEQVAGSAADDGRQHES